MPTCPTCGSEITIPPEPPLGTWVRDRHGGTALRYVDSDGHDGWGIGPGFYALANWGDMWAGRGPLVECGPWGRLLEEA